MTRPDGQSLRLNLEGESQFVSEIDAPGVYQIATPAQTKRIAVNLPFAESLTSPLDPELLENLGVVLGTMSAATDRVEVERQRRDKELESRQKLWRRMLIAAMVLIVLETLLSRHFTRKQIQGAADPQE